MKTVLPLLALLLAAPLAQAQVDLPITFEESIDYELRDFGGADSDLVADPSDAGNTVVRSVRTAGAESFAGTVVADINGLDTPIPFADGMTTLSVAVWTPEAGTPVRLKVEDTNDATVSIETQVKSDVAGAWHTLVFDFSRQVDGTAALDLSASYTEVVIFFDFGTEGATEATTYYWDDVVFGGDPPPPNVIALPITFEESGTDYELTDFGGNDSDLVADPEDATNTVVRSVRTANAEFFAGTTVAEDTGFDMPIPFTPSETTMSVRVWSPTAGIPVRFKVEDVNDPTISVEAELSTTVAGQWETLVYDFVDDKVPGTADIRYDVEYTKASIFFNFNESGATSPTTYYWDDVAFGGTATNSEDDPSVSQGVRLLPNYPNPFASGTTLRFDLPQAGRVTLAVYNLLGQRVATVLDETLQGGTHEVAFEAAGLASGAYVCRLSVGDVRVVRSLVVAR